MSDSNKEQEQPIIMVDSRKGSFELWPTLQAIGFEVRIEISMPFGDVSFTGYTEKEGISMIGVERKRIKDLLDCMRDGRLADHQLVGMSQYYEHYWLIVEGVIRCGDTGLIETPRGKEWVPVTIGRSTFTWEAYDHYVTSLELGSGLHVRRTSSPPRTCDQIRLLYDYYQKPWDQHRTLKVFHTAPPLVMMSRPTFLRRVAKELPNIGWEKSQPVAQFFRTFRRMANSAREEWERIEGIGKTISGKVIAAITGEEEQ